MTRMLCKAHEQISEPYKFQLRMGLDPAASPALDRRSLERRGPRPLSPLLLFLDLKEAANAHPPYSHRRHKCAAP
jgi:hypothetical protein